MIEVENCLPRLLSRGKFRKVFSQRHNRLLRIVLNQDYVDYDHRGLNHSKTLRTFRATNLLFQHAIHTISLWPT